VWKIFLIPLFVPGIAVEEQGPFPRSQLARILITVAPLVSGLLKNSSQPDGNLRSPKEWSGLA